MKMLQKIPENRLRVYLIWQPVLQSDNRASAADRAREFANEGLLHFWDGSRLTGRLWQRVLSWRDMPWDVYFLYRPDAHWEDAPTVPDFWMRQLNPGAAVRFESKIHELLGQTQ